MNRKGSTASKELASVTIGAIFLARFTQLITKLVPLSSNVPQVVVVLIRIREVSSLNLGWNMDTLIQILVPVPRGELQEGTLKQNTTLRFPSI
jgi:hypothetical protein